LLLNYVTEHDSRLKESTPCFFEKCLPGLTEEFKLKVFYHCSTLTPGKFGLKICVVLEEASNELLQKFELFSNQVFENLGTGVGIERIQQLEQRMFIK